jgi:tetratricopeptide (TPR) repeat protein
MGASLREKLERLPPARRGPAGGDGASLERLERSMLGSPGAELSLKQRLERLVAVATRGRGAQPMREARLPGARVGLEELVQGQRVTNERGEFFLVESQAHLESCHGEIPLTRFRALDPESVAVLSGEPELADFPLAAAAFVDTETTGVAGGAGTAAFLVGVGYVDGDRFRVRQYFMRDYHEEAALLRALAAELARFPALVTYNGKTFDLPLLESRYRLNRERCPLGRAAHLDLLQPARRLWKARLESCRLQSLERDLLGFVRTGDVPGDEIPHAYFDYLRRRDARAMARVFEHNRLDIVSLAALAIRACEWLERGRAADPRDILGVARVFERASRYERSEHEYRRALETDAEAARLPALRWLAARAKRSGDPSAAVPLWTRAAEEGDGLALRELAMHREHRLRDYAGALELVERALERRANAAELPRRVAADFDRRRARLRAKLARARAAASPARPAGSPRGPGSPAAS